MSTGNKLSPFQLEKMRLRFAKSGDLEMLAKTYSSNFSEIADLNSSALWDRLNIEHDQYASPMEKDKIDWVVKHTLKGIHIKSKVLNIGVGSGNLEDRMLVGDNFIGEWVGIDISQASIGRLSKKYGKHTFQAANVLKLPFPDCEFDKAISLEVLEHIKPSKTFVALGEINRVMKIGATLILSVPLNEGLDEMLLRGENPNAHVRAYEPEIVEAELELAGFRILKKSRFTAFRNNYQFKKIITMILPMFRRPNGIAIVAEKV